MKKALQFAWMFIVLFGFSCVETRAQLASYMDERGNRVYINPQELTPRRKPSAKPAAGAGTSLKQEPQPVAKPEAQASGATATSAKSASSLGPNSPKLSAVQPTEIDRVVQESAERNHVDPALVRAVITTESNWNPVAVSSKGAQGLMQLVPGTAQQLGVANPFDPKQNIDAGSRYLGMMLQRYNGDLSKALAAYNAGPGAVDRFGGVPNFHETRNYVQKVTATYLDPSSARQTRAYDRPIPIYRSTDSSGRVIFVNQ